MADLTATFNGLLKEREARPTRRRPFDVDTIDEFLKEAYRISSLISRLYTDLREVRQAYLSTAAPRKTHLRTKSAATQPIYLTDRQREEIDASTKLKLRELNGTIRTVADAEQLRQSTETALLQKKFHRGLGALGSWAAGGGSALGLGSSKSPEQVAAEDAAKQVGAHRESVLLYLRQRLQEVIRLQQGMMETRITREMEKKRSVLAKAGGGQLGLGAGFGDFNMTASTGGLAGDSSGRSAALLQEEERKHSTRDGPEYELTDAQVQMFEEGNQIMLKHMQSSLDKVRTAEQSLVEISELQTMLVNNLATQSAHIDQLVADSFRTEDNIGGGNKQLTKATQRASTARYTFFAATGLCLFLIGWDLII